MVALALYAAEPEARRRLERLVAALPDARSIGSADGPASLTRLLDGEAAEAVLAEAPAPGMTLADWLAPARRAAIILLLDEPGEEAALEAVSAGVSAVLARGAAPAEIAAAVTAATRGYGVVPRLLLDALLRATGAAASTTDGEDVLTPREFEVLTALADGASNKLIARRLGISFHTVKFHVAAILEKLDADSRAEAVARAVRGGLLML